MRRVRDDPLAPSFAVHEATQHRLRRLGQATGFEHPVWSVNDKDVARRWVEQLGVRQPRLIGEFPSPSHLPWAQLPDRVVLKPAHGAASRGVLLLARDPVGGTWRDLRTGGRLTPAELTRGLEQLAARGEVCWPLVAEELVEDPRHLGLPPVDWKVHTFFGRLGVVIAKSYRVDRRGRGQVRWRVFDERWRDLGRAVDRHPRDAGIRPPVHGEELLEVARRVSAAVPVPFLRVDLYDGVEGPVFGEITPEPGGDHRYRSDVDRWMGQLWEDGELRVLRHASAVGALAPSPSVLPAGLTSPGVGLAPGAWARFAPRRQDPLSTSRDRPPSA